MGSFSLVYSLIKRSSTFPMKMIIIKHLKREWRECRVSSISQVLWKARGLGTLKSCLLTS